MLIIYAHPNKNGHAGLVLEEVKKLLKESGKSFEVLDLYDINYNPNLLPREHYTSGNKEISEENKVFQNKFQEYNKFVFIYPTWWNNMPAILKGFLDRVLTGGFAFKFKGKFPVKLLSGRAVVFTTTGGPAIFSKLIKNNRSLKVLTKDTLEFCGIKTKGYLIGSANKLTESQKKKVVKTVSRGMQFLIK